jgi:predicted RNA-binding Zn-ribbon protein involved in translation (DUF1610 family)
MDPFKFSDWPPPRSWEWPADYRSGLGWIFALTILMSLVNIARAILYPHSRTLLQNLLVGPMFYSAMAAMCGVALWAIWKDKSWARWWAVATSSVYLLDFLKQFIIPVRPAWDHRLSSLIVAVTGVVAFSWRDKQADASRSDQPHNSRLNAVNLVVVGQIPKCPTCGVTVGYSRINIVNPFPCPHCGRQLMVPKTYFKRLRFFCAVLAIAVAVTVCCRYWAVAPKTDAGVWHAYLLLLLTFGVTSLVAGALGGIFVKRIFPPTLEDYEEYSKQAHYTAL